MAKSSCKRTCGGINVIRISFTEEEIAQLRYEQLHHPHPRVREKMEVVYLKAKGLSHKDIGEICNITQPTVRSYLTTYIEQGIEGLKVFCVQQPSSKLHVHKTSIEEEFRQRPPATVAEASGRIEELTGIKRGYTQVREFLIHLGLKPRKVGTIPAKADPVVQEDFLKKNFSLS